VFLGGAHSSTIGGNTINTWGVVNRAGLGALDGGGRELQISRNTFLVAAGGPGGGSAYAINLHSGSCAGSVITLTTDRGARAATLNVDATVGAIVATDVLTVAGPGAAKVSRRLVRPVR
jgi:hypothetical protein